MTTKPIMPAFTDNELVAITALAKEVERQLAEQFGVHLTTDRFNDLDDYLCDIVASVKENGQ